MNRINILMKKSIHKNSTSENAAIDIFDSLMKREARKKLNTNQAKDWRKK